MIPKRHLLRAIAAGSLGVKASAWAQATAWPVRPLRLLVGFPGGSTPDLMTRPLGDGLAQALGQTGVVREPAGRGRQHRRRAARARQR